MILNFPQNNHLTSKINPPTIIVSKENLFFKIKVLMLLARGFLPTIKVLQRKKVNSRKKLLNLKKLLNN